MLLSFLYGYLWVMGFEEGGTAEGGVKNMPVACFLARGRIHGRMTAGCKPASVVHLRNSGGFLWA